MVDLKKIFQKIANIVKNIIKMVQDNMKAQWASWDKEAELEAQQKKEPEKDLYDRYDEYYFGDGKKKRKKHD